MRMVQIASPFHLGCPPAPPPRPNKTQGLEVKLLAIHTAGDLQEECPDHYRLQVRLLHNLKFC